MDKIFGYCILGGALVGAMFGLIAVRGIHPLTGIGTGALIGTFVGWFLAAAILEQRKKEK